MKDNKIHVNIIISGVVQGVGFRYAAWLEARRRGIHGFVRNLYNGDVYVEAEGDSIAVDGFIQWCMSGPLHARVDRVSTEEGEFMNFTGFEIRP
ncbi:MAG: acylphosphatase [Bacteroidales bacterium]|nr:acylphosphatase [Bacteroidales bacterium]